MSHGPLTKLFLQMWSRHASFSISFSFLLGTAFLLLGTSPLEKGHAQTPPSSASDSSDSFQYELSGQISGTQAAFKDWQEGGLNSLSFATGLNGTAEQQTGRWTQQYDLRLAFGLLTTESDEEDAPLRKTEDQIQVGANLRYAGRGFLNRFEPTISGRLRTQFAKGFAYSDNPFPSDSPFSGQDPPVQISEFLAPAFLTQTLGLTYSSRDWYTLRLSAASKQTVVRDRQLGVLYDIDSGEQARVEVGAELAGTVDREIAPNVRYQSNATVFLSVGQIENPPDVVWENYLTMRVNSWLTTNLEFTALFDRNISTAIQLKQVLSLGVTIDLI